MHDQRNADGSSLPEREDAAATVLDILIGEHPSLVHVDAMLIVKPTHCCPVPSTWERSVRQATPGARPRP
jgi:hypothetical protein